MPKKPKKRLSNTAQEIHIFGRHSVIEAIKNPKRSVKRLIASPNNYDWALKEVAKRNKRISDIGINHELISIDIKNIVMLSPKEINKIVGQDAVHQGVVALIDNYDKKSIDEILDNELVLALDNITDPHNVGAIIRSAAAFNVKHIIVTSRNSPKNFSTLAKSASGGLEHVDIVEVVNLSRTIDEMKERGYFVVGLDSEAELNLDKAKISKPLLVIMGAEHVGLRALTRKKCDLMLKINISGVIKSLNVSNACAITLYQLSMLKN